MWHEVPDGKWNGQTAADAYKGPLKKVLKRVYPNATSHVVLEDNDPSGLDRSAASVFALQVQKPEGIKGKG